VVRAELDLGIVTMVNAARKIGATAVPLNYRLSDDEAAYVTDHSDSEVVYVDAGFADLFQRIRHRDPQGDHDPRVRWPRSTEGWCRWTI
jgi:acyl-CoA synthetase (AMP-forming)/AMP-acid ligase II